MKKVILILAILSAHLGANAQTARGSVNVGANYNLIVSKDGVMIYVKSIRGKSSDDSAKIMWQVKNNTNKPIFLEGNYQATGKPITGTYMNGEPAGKSRISDSLPGSKVNASSSEEFETYAEEMNEVNSITVNLEKVYKGDNIKSGSGN